MLAYRPHLVQMEQLSVDEDELAKMRQDKDAYQRRKAGGLPRNVNAAKARSRSESWAILSLSRAGRTRCGSAIKAMTRYPRLISEKQPNQRSGFV